MTDFQNQVRAEFSHHWRVLAVCVVLVAGALMIEKAFFAETITKSGLYYAEQSVIITVPEGGSGLLTASNEARYLSSFSMLGDFLEEKGGTYDFSKLEAGWAGMSKEQRLIWMQKHFPVKTEGNAKVFSIYLPASVRKDDAYLREHGKALLEDYIAFTESRVESSGLHPSYQKTTELEVLPEVTQVSKKRVLAKYGIIGTILGALLGCFILLANAVRKSRHA